MLLPIFPRCFLSNTVDRVSCRLILPTLLLIVLSHRVGKTSRRTRGERSASSSSARPDRIGGSQFAADRKPAISHVMVARLSFGGEFGVNSSTASSAGQGITAFTGTTARPSQGELSQAGSTGISAALRAAASGDGGGKCDGSNSGRDFCIAVSGGLASVLELVQPLQHIGWAGRDASATLAAESHGGGKQMGEVLRMARVPSAWRRTGLEAEEGQYPAFSSRPGGSSYGSDVVSKGEYDRIVTAAGTVIENADDGAGGFMIMCEGGWFGWYHICHGRFEVSYLTCAVAHNKKNIVANTPKGQISQRIYRCVNLIFLFTVLIEHCGVKFCTSTAAPSAIPGVSRKVKLWMIPHVEISTALGGHVEVYADTRVGILRSGSYSETTCVGFRETIAQSMMTPPPSDSRRWRLVNENFPNRTPSPPWPPRVSS